MNKTPTISEMEEFLLQDSRTKDLISAGDTQSKSPDTKLTAKQVQHEISVFSRVLINIYCGWPFHNKTLKRKILKMLIDIYEKAHSMTALDLLEQLKPVIQIIPDNHITLRMVGYNLGYRTGLRKKRPNVGSNVADDKKFIVELRKNIGVIGIRTLFEWSAEDKQNFEQQWRSVLPKAKTLIIDLRDNNGGGSGPVEKLVRYILGARPPIARREYIRNNPDANMVKKWKAGTDIDKFNVESTDDPVVFKDSTNIQFPQFDSTKAGFNGPIYVLINGKVMSAGELACTNMLNYPNVKFVGTNTCGGEVYGYNYAYILLPHTHMNFNVGCVYREMFVENFELNGYEPDIKCEDGIDAMAVAMTDIKKTEQCNQLENKIISRGRN